MDEEQLRILQAARLREARELRGFELARSAQLRFGWSSAYGHHENGTRGIGRAYRDYARAFQVNPAWILGHSEERDGDPDNEALARIEEKIDRLLDRIERIERRLK